MELSKSEIKEMIIVLHTSGKGESTPDYAIVKVFHNFDDAADYCDKNTNSGKHWNSAQIVTDSEKTELHYSVNF